MARKRKAKTLAEAESVASTAAVYVFRSRAPCPKCKSLDTVQYTTKGIVQYRLCRNPKCGHRFRVLGAVFVNFT